MKLSFNWLSEHVDLTGLTPGEVAERLTMSGLEVEGMEPIGLQYDPIRVGRILRIDPHPQADKLVLCQVEFGAEPLQIVCGASNIRQGDRVPVVPAGQRLPDGTKISKGKIRGEISHGMLCSAPELDLPGEASGILILPADATIGASLADVLSLRDTVLEVSVTPNRGDCLSVMGIAREVAALFHRVRLYPAGREGADLLSQGTAGPASDFARVEIEDIGGCPRYAAAVVLDVTVGPSPDWMARRLLGIGLRPVNNLVDVTNYVMMETGQPLHVFDLDRIRKDPDQPCHILVRSARTGERMESIDHLVRELDPEDLLITDGKRPIAVAGVMGGVESEVSEYTRHIVIECAHFNPTRIRRTSKRLAMGTESSYRFERTVDIEGIPTVLERVVALVVRTDANPEGQPRVARGLVDVYPARWHGRSITLRVDRANDLLGIHCAAQQMADYLQSLEIEVRETSSDRLVVVPPSFRPDLEREVDLIEEVGRLLGLDRIPARLPSAVMGLEHQPRSNGGRQTLVKVERLNRIDQLRERLSAMGMMEAINYSFISPAAIRSLRVPEQDPHGRPVELANPLSEEWSVLRTSLLPGLLENIRRNLAHREPSLALFEIGPIFLHDPEVDTGTGVREEQMVAGVLCGRRGSQWLVEATDFGIFDLKGMVADLSNQFSHELEFTNHQGRFPYLHPGVGAELRVSGQAVGVMGQIHPLVAERFEIAAPVYGFELSMDALLALGKEDLAYQPFSRYPSATRDLALVVDRELPYGAIEQAILEFSNPLIESFALCSTYEGDPIEPGKKSVALAITYRSPSASLTDDKIDGIHGRLAQHVCDRVSAQRR